MGFLQESHHFFTLSNISSTGILSGTPANINVGANHVIIKVTDGTDAVYQEFNILVEHEYYNKINNINSPSECKIYPNPSNDIFNISVENSNEKIRSIVVYNQLGMLVLSDDYEKAENSVQINLQNNANGYYFVKIKTNLGISVKKILKQ